MLLLAELTAPTLQPGPVRLPAPPPLVAPNAKPAPEPPPLRVPASPPPEGPAPAVRGFMPYRRAVLEEILAPCRSVGGEEARLAACAEALLARLFRDGYISTRVLPLREPAPGVLEVVPGRIVRIDVLSPSPRLQRRVNRLVRPLQGAVLNLPRLSASLNQLQRLPGVGRVQSSLNRVARDSGRAVLLLTVDPGTRPLRGEVSLRLDGNAGSGQFRGLATLLQPDLAIAGDTLLLSGELNSDSDPELGYRSGSLSYSLPLTDAIQLTAATGLSRRQLVEAEPPIHDLAYRQLQLYGQFDLTLRERLGQRLYSFVALSVNRSDAFLAGRPIAVLPGGGEEAWVRNGYARFGLGVEFSQPSCSLDASLYGLQALAALTPERQRQELAFLGMDVSRARAIGSQLSLAWSLAPRWLLELRFAGQAALEPLPSSMGFSLGSDAGLRGLPGQVISGDSGLLGSVELSRLIWSTKRQSLQLVPFLGAGNVWTEVPGASLRDAIGAGGVLLRWSRDSRGVLELGWVKQFQTDTRTTWDQWILGSGVYAKMSYRF